MSRRLVFVLLVLGVSVGAIGAARIQGGVDWRLVAVGAALLAGAVVILRLEARRAGAAPTGGAGDPLRELDPLAQAIGELSRDGPSLESEALLLRLDDVLARIDRLAETRPVLLARLGTTGFALRMSALAGAERLLARAWSAAADRHLPESHAALAQGARKLEQALADLRAALAAGGG